MTYPAPFLRLVCSGPLYVREGWSWGLSLVPAADGIASRPLVVPAAVRTAVEQFVATQHHGGAPLGLIKINEIGPDGRYTQEQTVQHDYGTTPAPGGGVTGLLPQAALAVSIDTAKSRGLAARGRFYVPARYNPSSDGRVPVDDATAMMTAATTMIEAINTALPDYRVGVASDVGAGAFEPARRVRVGRVIDTIRSRRTSLDEGYIVGDDLSTFAGDGGGF